MKRDPPGHGFGRRRGSRFTGDRAVRCRVAAWAAAGLAACGAGCAPAQNRFLIHSVRPDGAMEALAAEFEPGVFAQDAQGAWDIVLQAAPAPIPETANAANADGAEDSSREPAMHAVEARPPRGGTLRQALHLRVFWRAQPGRTFAERTQTNANLRYAVLVGDRVLAYEGAGFVYFEASADGGSIKGTVESSSLSPAGRVGEIEDVIGPCRIEGSFTARRDKARTVEALQRLRRQAVRRG